MRIHATQFEFIQEVTEYNPSVFLSGEGDCFNISGLTDDEYIGLPLRTLDAFGESKGVYVRDGIPTQLLNTLLKKKKVTVKLDYVELIKPLLLLPFYNCEYNVFPIAKVGNSVLCGYAARLGTTQLFPVDTYRKWVNAYKAPTLEDVVKTFDKSLMARVVAEDDNNELLLVYNDSQYSLFPLQPLMYMELSGNFALYLCKQGSHINVPGMQTVEINSSNFTKYCKRYSIPESEMTAERDRLFGLFGINSMTELEEKVTLLL